jgi:hypothetical protein
MVVKGKRKKDDSDYRPPTTEKLKESILDSLTSRIKDAKTLPLVQFILDHNSHAEKGWIRTLFPKSSSRNNVLSEEERKTLVYLRTVFKVGLIPISQLEYAFKLQGPHMLSIVNVYFECFDSPDLSMPQLLSDENDSPAHMSPMSTPLAQATKRARTGPTPPVQIDIVFEVKNGEEEVEVSFTDTPSPCDLDDDTDEFAYREPTSLFKSPLPQKKTGFKTPSPGNNVAVEDETPPTARRSGFLNRLIQSARKKARRNVSSVGRLFQSATKAASRNVSTLLRSAQKVSSHRNDRTSDGITEAIELLSSEVVNKGVIREELMGLAVAVFDAAAKEGTDSTFSPFIVRYKPLSAKKKSNTKMYVEIPVPRRAQEDTTEESRKHKIRLRSARLHAYAKGLCGDDVEEQQAAVTSLVQNRMGGFLNWSGNMQLDVEDCIVVRERTGGLSTTKLITALDTISKLLGKRIYPTQLKKKIAEVEWGLLEVRHRLVEVEVEKGKKKHCVFYWVPNLPLLQEMLIVSAMIEG